MIGVRMTICRLDGEVLEQITVRPDKAQTELPDAEFSRRVVDYLNRRWDLAVDCVNEEGAP